MVKGRNQAVQPLSHQLTSTILAWFTQATQHHQQDKACIYLSDCYLSIEPDQSQVQLPKTQFQHALQLKNYMSLTEAGTQF